MSKAEIPIAEQFFSVQGEGPHNGVPSLFLRLSGCNLSCGLTESDVSEFEKGQDPEAGAQWVCDTIDVWRTAKRVVPVGELVDEWQDLGWFGRLYNGANLVVTGGEPLIKSNQQSLFDLFQKLSFEGGSENEFPTVEVETNGTVMPQPSIRRFVSQWNVSLKLSNSGMAESRRLDGSVIGQYISIHEYSLGNDATFKFVVHSQSDVSEVKEIKERYGIPDSMISLMPAGQTREQLAEKYSEVAEYCKANNWRFSPRLHVNIWNKQTGV